LLTVAFLSDPWGVATLRRQSAILPLQDFQVAFLSDPWGVATDSRRIIFFSFSELHFYLTRGELQLAALKRFTTLDHGGLHFYLTRGELQLACNFSKSVLRLKVAFLSDPWGVAT